MNASILVSVWPEYRWLVPVLTGMLADFWPNHPELIFTKEIGDGKNWTQNLLAGVEEAKKKGFESVYLINEEHVPVGPCNELFLNSFLPDLASRLGAVYVSLFGWDNKRFCSKSNTLSRDQFRWMHLVGKVDPRFHLHPAWWRVDALEACCRLVLEDGCKNGSAWHFEKICADPRVTLPEDYRRGCYQISAAATKLAGCGEFRFVLRCQSRWLANKAMALLPHLKGRLRAEWLKFWNFDAVVSDGAYPMVFSGVLAKGRINPVFVNYSRGCNVTGKWLHRIQELMEVERSC